MIQAVKLKQTAAPNVKGHVPGQIIKHRGALEHLAGRGTVDDPTSDKTSAKAVLQLVGAVEGRSHLRSLMPSTEPNHRRGQRTKVERRRATFSRPFRDPQGILAAFLALQSWRPGGGGRKGAAERLPPGRVRGGAEAGTVTKHWRLN